MTNQILLTYLSSMHVHFTPCLFASNCSLHLLGLSVDFKSQVYLVPLTMQNLNDTRPSSKRVESNYKRALYFSQEFSADLI